jgi:NhaP-type Na+/H+ or K+/H+ antiporter
MYQNAAMLAAFLLIYSAIAGRIERSWISGPMVFTGVGFILGPDGLGVLQINIGGEGLRLLAELTLAMVLFTDAANADFGVVRRNLGLPERLLLIGLPLTIVLGYLLAAAVFPSLETLEIALLAACWLRRMPRSASRSSRTRQCRRLYARRSTWKAASTTASACRS